MKIASVEEIKKVRQEHGLGLLEAKQLVQGEYAHQAVEQATSLEELKPVLAWLINGRK